MTDTPTTMSMLEEHELFTIEKLLDEYVDADNTIPKIAWVRVLSDYRTLQAKVAELEVENERYREALEFYACDDTYLPVMEGDGTPITGTVVVLHDGGHIARVALGYEEETWFNPRDVVYPDHFIAHAQSDIPALLKTIAELREVVGWYAEPRNYNLGVPGTWDTVGYKFHADNGERARAALGEVDGEGA